jgi:hypothetical protein
MEPQPSSGGSSDPNDSAFFMRQTNSGMDAIAIAQEFRFATAPGAKNKPPLTTNNHLQISPPPMSETFNLESKIRSVNQAEQARHAPGLNVSQERPQTPRLTLDQSKNKRDCGFESGTC